MWARRGGAFMHAWDTRGGAMQSVQELETGGLARRADARSDREATEQHEQRLARRREKDRAKRQSERAEDREERLLRRREQAGAKAQTQQAKSSRLTHSSQSGASESQLHEHKLLNFHSRLASLQSATCSSCLECWPNLNMASHSTECSRCSKDKNIPKLYSSANNMDPGPIPTQLQVCHNLLSSLVHTMQSLSNSFQFYAGSNSS